MFVFDETIIGHKGTLPKVIGERRASGGGTINVIQKRERALGSYIPFSTLDGRTPFRVFITNEKTCGKWMTPEDPIVPAEEKGLRETPHRLFLSSETGYVSTELFTCIMDDFTNWWTTTNPGVDCLLISDNLAIHKNKAIVAKAEDRGIHMLNIIPGSSHWFQVHDQQPFAVLKKKLISSFYDIFSGNTVDPEAMMELRLAKLYEAEREALKPSAVLKACEYVGLSPWNPSLIRENCKKHYLPILAQSRGTSLTTYPEESACISK